MEKTEAEVTASKDPIALNKLFRAQPILQIDPSLNPSSGYTRGSSRRQLPQDLLNKFEEAFE